MRPEKDTVLSVEGLCKSFAGIAANRDVCMSIAAGQLHAVIGPNGAGKTTLISLLSGETKPDAGTVRLEGRDITRLPAAARARIGLQRSFQITSVFLDLTVLDNAILAVQGQRAGSLYSLGQDPDILAEATALLAVVGIEPLARRPVETLAHGARRQLELAMTLAGSPRLLLLDEPLAGAGPEESLEVIRLLGKLRARHAILLVEHDMEAVFSLADQITVMVGGAVIASGTPDAIRRNSSVQEAYLGVEACS